MKTKIINGTVHFKRKRFIFLNGEIKKVKQVNGHLRIVHNKGTTYVVLPYDADHFHEGYMIPIIEDYDSLE
jgi:hypothetical protein